MVYTAEFPFEELWKAIKNTSGSPNSFKYVSPNIEFLCKGLRSLRAHKIVVFHYFPIPIFLPSQILVTSLLSARGGSGELWKLGLWGLLPSLDCGGTAAAVPLSHGPAHALEHRWVLNQKCSAHSFQQYLGRWKRGWETHLSKINNKNK